MAQRSAVVSPSPSPRRSDGTTGWPGGTVSTGTAHARGLTRPRASAPVVREVDVTGTAKPAVGRNPSAPRSDCPTGGTVANLMSSPVACTLPDLPELCRVASFSPPSESTGRGGFLQFFGVSRACGEFAVCRIYRSPAVASDRIFPIGWKIRLPDRNASGGVRPLIVARGIYVLELIRGLTRPALLQSAHQ